MVLIIGHPPSLVGNGKKIYRAWTRTEVEYLTARRGECAGPGREGEGWEDKKKEGRPPRGHPGGRCLTWKGGDERAHLGARRGLGGKRRGRLME